LSANEFEQPSEPRTESSAVDVAASPEAPSVTKHRFWYFSEWNESLRQFVLALPRDEFIEVLLGSDPLNLAMQELGLSQVWKRATASKLTKRDAVISILERVRKALREYTGKRQVGSGLVLSWWGRRSVLAFKGTELEAQLNAHKVALRFTHTVHWLQTAGERAAPIQEALLSRRGSAQLLERVFAGLMLSAQAGDGGDVLSSSISEWMGAKTLGAQQPNKKEQEPIQESVKAPPKQAHVDAVLAESLRPTPEVPAPTLPRVRETEQPLNPPNQDRLPEQKPSPAPLAAKPSLSPELEKFRGMVSEIHQELREARQCMDELRLDEVAAHTSRAKQLQNSVEQGISSLWMKLEETGKEQSHSIPRHVFQEPTAADEYFLALLARLQELEQSNAEAVERGKLALKSELQELNLPVPAELEHANNREALRVLTEFLNPLIQQERACQRLLQPGVDPDSLGISAARRLAFYCRRTEMPERDAATLLVVVNRDPRALVQETDQGRILMAELIRALMEAEKPLSPGTWRTLGSLRGEMSPVQLLTRLDLMDHLHIADTKLLDLEGLHALVGDERSLLPDELRYKLDRYELLGLPENERIPRLAALALEDGLDETTIQELLTTLAASGRYAETVALAVLAAHASRLKSGAHHLRNALLTTLVQLATREDRHDIVRAFLQDASWLTHEPDDVAVLLHLSMVTRYPGPFENLRFQEPGALHASEQARPALVGRCLLPEANADGIPLDHKERERARRAGRQALHEWDHDLPKRTCYASFDSAVDYQDYFREQLEFAFEELNPQRPPPNLDPAVLVEQARVAKNLPRVHGPVLDAMKEYLRKQIRRLEQLYTASGHLGGIALREGLAREEPELRASLEREASQTKGTPAVQLIYQQVLARL
jgi:hypothetical protein